MTAQKLDIPQSAYKIPGARLMKGARGKSLAASGKDGVEGKSIARHGRHGTISKNALTGYLAGMPGLAVQRTKQAGHQAVEGARAKAAADTMMWGPTHPWRECADGAWGYNLWGSPWPTMLDWLAMPPMPENRTEFEIQIFDFRPNTQGYGSESGSGDEWCDLGEYQAPTTHGCVIRICFNQNQFYWTGMQSFTPADFAKVCRVLPSIRTPEGLNLDNNYQFERYMMYARQREAALTALILDDAFNPSGANEAPTNGLISWFENYLLIHPEVVGTCEELAPQTIDLGAIGMGSFVDIPTAVADRLWEIQYKLRQITRNNNLKIPLSMIALAGNDLDVECLLRAQTCVRMCNGTLGVVFRAEDIATPSGRAMFDKDYMDHSEGGTFNHGYLDLPRAMGQLSLVRDSNIPQGDGFFLLIKGWPGYEMGLRVFFNDWSTWYNDYIAYHPAAAARIRLEPGSLGTMLYIEDDSNPVCPKANLRWFFQLDSGAPWLQTRFVNYEECDLVDPSLSPFPETEHNVACPPIVEEVV